MANKTITHRYNVCAAKEYTNAQNERKTTWVKLGTAVMFDDGSIIQNIDCLPNGNWWDGKIQLFKQESQNQQGGYSQAGGYGQQSGPYHGGYQQPQGATYSRQEPPMPPEPYDNTPF